MSRAGSAARSLAKATGDHGVASRTLRAPALSPSFGGSGTSWLGLGLLGSALVLALTCVLALAAGPAHAGKQVDSFFGGFGSGAGEFTNPQGVAVNQATGDVYVAESSRHRVQRFDAEGEFELMWGHDVDSTGGTGFEVCTVAANCQGGQGGGGTGQFFSPDGIAIDQADGSVYVTDSSNRRVSKFDADGDFLFAFGWGVDTGTAALETCTTASGCERGLTGAGAGQLTSSSAMIGLAVDPSTGDLLVADIGNRRVQRFDSAGGFVSAFGWGVDTESAALESCTAASGCQAGLQGDGLGQFGHNSPAGVAVDSAGAIYALDEGNGRVLRFDSAGGSAAVFGSGAVATSPAPSVLAVDPATDNVLVVQRDLEADEAHIKELDSAGALVDTHLVGAGVEANTSTSKLRGLAANGSTGDIYAADVSMHVVLILDDDGAPPAVVTVAPPTDVGAHGATLHGSVDPTASAADYRFEYSEDGLDWVQAGDGGTVSGDEPVDVSAVATGLEANTFYRVRLVATKRFGGPTTVSPELTFLTDSPPPEVQTGPVQHRTATSAQLLGSINPNKLETTYRFEYGPTADYGSSAPVPDASAGAGGQERQVVQHVGGLDPDRTYHYRLVATNARGTTEGADRQFTTRAASAAGAGERVYEMVTLPDKNNRRAGAPRPDHAAANPGMPSPDGESLLFALRYGILDADAGTAFPHQDDMVVIDRGAGGWQAKGVQDIPGAESSALPTNFIVGASADLDTQAWRHSAFLFPSGGKLSTWVDGASGGYGGSEWYEWDVAPTPTSVASQDRALVDSQGERMLRWAHGNERYRGFLGPDDPSNQQLSGSEGGTAVYLQEPPGSGARVLVNECSGTVDGGDATELPSRESIGGPQAAAFVAVSDGSEQVTVMQPLQGSFGVGQVVASGPGGIAGAKIVAVDGQTLTLSRAATASGSGLMIANPDVLIDTQPCETGSVTSLRGAIVGGGGATDVMGGPTARAMSEDGRRVFFMSPDPTAPGVPEACGSGTGPDTDCPPQLFVRQLDSSGEPVVRWISRSQIEGQAIGLLGGGAAFEGASADGSVVYFRTNAPLTADDPNGGAVVPGGVKTGSASNDSWDLYRYELPADLDADPADGTLTRVSGGPSGEADPATHCGAGACTNSQNPAGLGSAARHVSDDGDRVYFVTASPIDGADTTPPAGGVTTPEGSKTDNDQTRNLYLYDASKSGADAYTFVASIPYGTSARRIDACASRNSATGMSESLGSDSSRGASRASASCVRGTADGGTLVFETTGRLTADDTDDVSDIYLYDAAKDGLTRVSASPPRSEPYVCSVEISGGSAAQFCKADLGFQGPLYGDDERVGLGGQSHANLAVDGSGVVSVFFESRIPLVPGDVNGDRMDVYEWRAGELSLVSPGDSDDDSWYSGNSVDGQDVFFQTSKRIDPREVEDGDFDIYDARVGGGFAPPPARPQVCAVLGDGCQGAGAERVGAVVRSDDDAGGAGNVQRGERTRLRLAGPGRRALARAARTGVLAVRVRSSAAGRLAVVARGRLARRRGGAVVRAVARQRVRLAKAGTRVVRLRLSRPAVRQLRARGRLVVRVAVRQRDARPRAVRLVLRGTGRQRGAGRRAARLGLRGAAR